MGEKLLIDTVVVSLRMASDARLCLHFNSLTLFRTAQIPFSDLLDGSP